MQFKQGDLVVHIGFPEVIGEVKVITPMPNNKYKIGVWVEDDYTGQGRIFYDVDDKWKSAVRYPYPEDPTRLNDAYSDKDIVEVEYEIIE